MKNRNKTIASVAGLSVMATALAFGAILANGNAKLNLNATESTYSIDLCQESWNPGSTASSGTAVVTTSSLNDITLNYVNALNNGGNNQLDNGSISNAYGYGFQAIKSITLNYVASGDNLTVDFGSDSGSAIDWYSTGTEVASQAKYTVTGSTVPSYVRVNGSATISSITVEYTCGTTPVSTPDLVVYVHTSYGSNTYISDDDFNALGTYFSENTSYNITWKKLTGIAASKIANANLTDGDMVIGGKALSSTLITFSSTQGKVICGTGWFADNARYVGVLAACAEGHAAAATAVYTALAAVKA